jgi:hypothetical protein
MAGIEMKLRRAFQLLAGVALLGAIATYIEITRTTAQPSERFVKSGEAANMRIAARSADPVVEGSAPGNPPTTAQPTDPVVKSGDADDMRTAARSADPVVESFAPRNPRTTVQPTDPVVKSGEADDMRTAARSADPVVERSAPENPRTTAQPTDPVVKSGEADGMRTAARSADPAVESSTPGNPLWALPLKQLSTTRERPIFSPSRRPPPPATPTYVAPVAIKRPEKPAEPERPAVSLLGTVIGDADRLGVFIETATGTMVRMRVGEDHQGWVLRLIKAREVTLVKDRELVAVLELPAAGESATLGNQSMPGGIPGAMPGGIPGAMPGGIPGAMPGAIPGAIPRAIPGATMPGTQQIRRQSAR